MSEAEELLEAALRRSRDTRFLGVDPGIRRRAAAVFESLFGSSPAIVVADSNTFEAAGRDVQDSLTACGHDCRGPFVFGPNVYAEDSFVEELYGVLRKTEGIPVAVGSGTINDITKLVAHRLKRPYMAVATAASMDGYTAFGASITRAGSKETFDCPAPLAVLADLEVIGKAPAGLNASGYADLLAKCAAGADWMVADAAGVEPIEPSAWNLVQASLRSWVSSPQGVRENEPACLRLLIQGLMVSGFAMQSLCSSRPSSGAEHQFSHLWDMQHHTHNGGAPSHGFKVGIGTLASVALYEQLISLDPGHFVLEASLESWPSLPALEARAKECLGWGPLAAKAVGEIRAKYVTREELRGQLVRLRDTWPQLRQRLRQHLLSFLQVRDMLREAGCPSEPEQIGISRQRLRLSYEQACFIRRRFTVLDFAARWGLTQRALKSLFGTGGPWPLTAPNGAEGKT